MTTPQIVLVFVLAVTAGLIKSTSGFGYPLLLVPIFSQFMEFVDAVLLVAPSNLFLNVAIVWRLREKRHDAATLKSFTGFGVVGAIVGTLLLPWLPPNVARSLLLVVLSIFLYSRLKGIRYEFSDRDAQRYAPIAGSLAGVCQGAIGVSGPIVTPWFLSLDRGRDVFVFSVAFTFGITGLVQVAVAGINNLYTATTLAVGLGIIPLVALTVPVGARIRQRISTDAFEKFVIALLTVSGLALLLRVLGVT